LENFLTGWAGGFSAGIGLGTDPFVVTLSENPTVAGDEFGLYTPQVGVGAVLNIVTTKPFGLYPTGRGSTWLVDI
jgi:hypothetical protein